MNFFNGLGDLGNNFSAAIFELKIWPNMCYMKKIHSGLDKQIASLREVPVQIRLHHWIRLDFLVDYGLFPHFCDI